jgi:hypothetical protein
MIYFHSKCDVPSTSDTLEFISKRKDRYLFRAVAMLFYILQSGILGEVQYFLGICYHIQFKVPTLDGAGVVPTSKVPSTAVLVLFTRLDSVLFGVH